MKFIKCNFNEIYLPIRYRVEIFFWIFLDINIQHCDLQKNNDSKWEIGVLSLSCTALLHIIRFFRLWNSMLLYQILIELCFGPKVQVAFIWPKCAIKYPFIKKKYKKYCYIALDKENNTRVLPFELCFREKQRKTNM
jgi:hypothetical protein